MLDLESRAAVLKLHREGHSIRAISRAVRISRNAVRSILRSGQLQPPPINRQMPLAPHLDRIRELYLQCRGNVVRVQEELQAEGRTVPYSSLTRFCRLHQIGTKKKRRIGSYDFEPGQEMQHDTSPHDVEIGGKVRRVHCAALILCFCRMLFAQVYARWNRFYCRVFFTEALQYFKGAARQSIIDNSSVILAGGSGPDAVISAEMEAFSARFGFEFVAHHLGDPNRKGRIERPFHYIENNFYAGRKFEDITTLNLDLRQWCDRVNHSYKKHIRARPIELFATEAACLVPLPLHIPTVYALHQRRVDPQGYVTLHTNRYSVPDDLISREVEVHETMDRIQMFVSGRLVAEHHKFDDQMRGHRTTPGHHGRTRSTAARPRQTLMEESHLQNAGEEIVVLLQALKKRHRARATRAIKRLYGLYLDYPDQPLRIAIRQALSYGLLDLDRIEKMVLRAVADNFFTLRSPQ